MLSRTAESLFWMARYTERAGNVARGIFVTRRMAAAARSLGTEGAEWRSLLVAAGCDPGFREKHAEPTQEAAMHYLVHDRDNPSSIRSCIEAARHNGRTVRTALTVDMWEVLNDTWNALRAMPEDATEDEKLSEFLGWVRERVMLFNGATDDTMLRDEAWRFVHLGTMLERADNTARLLDVKHGLLAPHAEGAVDYVQWQSILRSVSALRAYQYLFRDRLRPERIAELIILRPELPRSLAACHAEVRATLEAITAGQGGRSGECHRLAGELGAKLQFGRVDAILEGGLHAFLTEMIEATSALGREIEAFYIRH